jgi:hypothetical protein
LVAALFAYSKSKASAAYETAFSGNNNDPFFGAPIDIILWVITFLVFTITWYKVTCLPTKIKALANMLMLGTLLFVMCSAMSIFNQGNRKYATIFLGLSVTMSLVVASFFFRAKMYLFGAATIMLTAVFGYHLYKVYKLEEKGKKSLSSNGGAGHRLGEGTNMPNGLANTNTGSSSAAARA